MHDLPKPHVTEVLVRDPRKKALLKVGNKNDRVDARCMHRAGILIFCSTFTSANNQG